MTLVTGVVGADRCHGCKYLFLEMEVYRDWTKKKDGCREGLIGVVIACVGR